MNAKIGIDISALSKVTQVACMALDCEHNTANRSHGQSAAACDYKHICIGEYGKCKSHSPKLRRATEQKKGTIR